MFIFSKNYKALIQADKKIDIILINSLILVFYLLCTHILIKFSFGTYIDFIIKTRDAAFIIKTIILMPLTATISICIHLVASNLTIVFIELKTKLKQVYDELNKDI